MPELIVLLNTTANYKTAIYKVDGIVFGTDIDTHTLDGIIANSVPTVALNTPSVAATNQSLTPTLNFTGTDIDGETIEYEVQIDTVNTFDAH